MAYIPSKDADLMNWGNNYTTLLTADPPRYGIMPADALLLQTEYNDFAAAYALAINPVTRTKVNVAAKDGHKALFLQLARAYASQIRANRGVVDEDKVALGLTIPDPTPTPIPVPSTHPVLGIPLVGVNVHMMSIVDQLTPALKAKPAGVVGCALFRKIGPIPVTVFDDFELTDILTRADELIDTTPAISGEFITYAAKWFNRKGEFGPLSGFTGSRVL